MSGQDALYDRDFFAWTEEQAARLRAAAAAGTNAPIDWAHVATEIEDLGRSAARELLSRLTTITEHLLKLERSADPRPRAGWVRTVLRERLAVLDLLEENPSLRPRVAGMLPVARERALKLLGAQASRGVEGRAPSGPAEDAARWSEEQILGEFLPGQPDGASRA